MRMLMHLRPAASRHCNSPGPNMKDTREWCECRWPHGDLCTHHSWIQPAIDKNHQVFIMDQHGTACRTPTKYRSVKSRANRYPGLCKIDSIASTNNVFDSKHFQMDCLCSEPPKNSQSGNPICKPGGTLSVE